MLVYKGRGKERNEGIQQEVNGSQQGLRVYEMKEVWGASFELRDGSSQTIILPFFLFRSIL